MKTLVVLSVVFAVSLAAPSYVYTYLAQPENVPAVFAKTFAPAHTVLASPSFVNVPATYVVPATTVYSGGAAVSHQSRVDIKTSPAVVTEQVVEPAVVAARTVVEPVSSVESADSAVVTPVHTVVAAPAAVSHQSRVDVHTSAPKFVAAEPVVFAKTFASAQTVLASPSFVNVPSAYVAPVSTVYSGGAAVSHQSRVDVKTSPAVVTEQVVEPAYLHATSVVEASPAFVDSAPAVVDARSVHFAPVNTFYSGHYIKK